MISVISCTTSTRLLNKIPVNSIDVKVLDQDGNPVGGAQIESSNGRLTTTNAQGMANVSFGSVGVHSLTVLADNFMPNNFVVTMPSDRGETFTVRLNEPVEYTTPSASSFGFGSANSFGSANMYPMLFSYMFSSYGYGLELDGYEEGEWTKWNISTGGDDEAMTIRKGFLKQLENGQEWWQIVLVNVDDEGTSYTAEILFSEDRSSIRRYREKIGDNAPQEKPVSEGWYTQPTQLTTESQEGAVSEENIAVTIPKGTYTADRLEFGVAPQISLNIWRTSEDVPGGVLKYQTGSTDGDLIYQSELQDFGSDATTMLDSF